MKKPLLRYLTLFLFSMLLLAGCSSKKLEAKIKQLETEMAELQASHDEEIGRKEHTISEKVAAMDKAENIARDKISELTRERDQFDRAVKELQRKLDGLQAEADARKTVAKSSGPGSEIPDLSKDSKFADAMVLITGDASKGLGVVVEDSGKKYIYTSGSVLAGNTRLSITNASGVKFSKFGKLQTAVGFPLVRIELLESDAVAIALGASNSEISTTKRLCCLSLNPQGGGAVSGVAVTAYGQTKAAIECDARMLEGKSGAAIVDTETGKVLAVVGDRVGGPSNPWGGSSSSEARVQVGIRINSDISWQPVSIISFLDESKKIENFNEITTVVSAFAAMSPSPDGLGLSGVISDGPTIQSVLAAASGVPVAAEAITFDSQLSEKKVRLGAVDLKRRLNGLFSGVASLSKGSRDDFVPSEFSAYYRKAAEESLKRRSSADQGLKVVIDGLDNLELKSSERNDPGKFDR